MLVVRAEDFLEKAASAVRLSREEERHCAEQMKLGDAKARERIVESYLPQVAGHVRHLSAEFQTLTLIYGCLTALEKAVDSFDFLQDSETFTHRLSWWLRQTVTRYIAETNH